MRQERNMPEGTLERERVDSSSFILSGIKSQGEAMARYSIGLTPTPAPEDVASEKALGQFLSEVRVDDPQFESLGSRLKTNIDQALLSEAASMTYAKLEAAKQVASTPVKKELADFQPSFLGKVSDLLASNTLTRRAFIKASPALMGTILAACSSGADAGTLPRPIETEIPTPQVTEAAESTQIAPNPMETPETSRLISGEVLEEAQIQSELLSYQPFADFYQHFQDEVRANPELHDENATFGITAIRAQTSEGEYIYPFFTVAADPESPDGKTFTAMVIDLDGVGYTAVSLERSTMAGTDGIEYTVLSLTKDGYGNPLEAPIPIFAVPSSEVGNPEATALFNPLGTAREDSIGVRLASLREMESVITPEAPVYELGTLVINPEYSLGGRVEIIPENIGPFYDYFLDAFFRINEEEMSQLRTNDETSITNPSILRSYLEENGGVLPPGFRIPIIDAGNYIYARPSEPLDLPLSLRFIFVEFIDENEYRRVTLDYQNPEPYIKPRFLFSPYGGSEILANVIRVGMVPHLAYGQYTLSLQVIDLSSSPSYGFPQGEEQQTEHQIELLNSYLQFWLYLTRSMSTRPPTELIRAEEWYMYQINELTGIGRVSNLDFFFRDMNGGQFADEPPILIR